jgi:hypothetical protein
VGRSDDGKRGHGSNGFHEDEPNDDSRDPGQEKAQHPAMQHQLALHFRHAGFELKSVILKISTEKFDLLSQLPAI